MERSCRDSHLLPNMYFGIDRDDFICIARFLERRNQPGVDCGQVIAKLNDPLNARRMSDAAMLIRIDKVGEEISWEHRFDEPDRTATSHLAKTKPWRVTGNVELPAKSEGGKMLAFRLCAQAKPERSPDDR